MLVVSITTVERPEFHLKLIQDVKHPLFFENDLSEKLPINYSPPSSHIYSLLENMCAKLNDKKEKINAQNVFPIPDGDTGVNMFLTLQVCYEQFVDVVGVGNLSLRGECGLLEKGAFLGAKGNSGVILSQFIQGMCSYLENYEALDLQNFTEALEEGLEWAYDSVMNSVEGTILTIMKDTAACAKELMNASYHYLPHEYFELLKIAGRDSLKNTPNLLPILKEKGKVDAGGLGFVYILETLEDYFVAEYEYSQKEQRKYA